MLAFQACDDFLAWRKENIVEETEDDAEDILDNHLNRQEEKRPKRMRGGRPFKGIELMKVKEIMDPRFDGKSTFRFDFDHFRRR